MNIEWTEKLAVGHAEIDIQHQELLKRLSALWSAVSRGTGRDEIKQTIDFLEDYVLIHFNTEENQMKIHHYSQAELHIEKHREFARMIENLKEQLGEKGPNQNLAIQTVNVMFKWFIIHIDRMDKELGGFLRC